MTASINLCIVGMPKAGTTSLHHYLSEHPDICMSTDKEPHFFSTDLLAEGEKLHGFPKYTRYPTLQEYKQLFSHKPNTKIVGESSVFYLFSHAAHKEIYAHNPKTKIVIMLREPTAFLYSLHSQGLYSGNETEADFTRALDLETSRRLGENLPPTVHFPSRLFYTEHIKIAEQISRYLETFPRENIHICLFDDFKKNPQQHTQEVFRFLGVDDKFLPSLEHHNPNTKMKSTRLARIIQDPSNPITYVGKRILPKRIWKPIKEILIRVNTDSAPRKAMDAMVEKRLRELCAPEVQNLQEILHQQGFLARERNLMQLWGYTP